MNLTANVLAAMSRNITAANALTATMEKRVLFAGGGEPVASTFANQSTSEGPILDRMTRTNLEATKYSPDEDALDEQLMTLSEMIDTTPEGPRKDFLCAAFQALQWARCPTGFAPPSQS